MSSQTILNIILVILIADFALERLLNILNQRRWTAQLPDAVKGIYDEQKYRKSQEYKRDKDNLGLLSSMLSFIVVVGMIYWGGFAWIDEMVRNYFTHPIAIALLFFGVIMLFSGLMNLPFSWYSVFVVEEKYGFNRTTPKTFVMDAIKGGLLGAVLGGGLLSLIIWIYLMTTTNFWWIAWVVVAIFTIFMSMFYSSLIVPLFNKQTPLKDGELRDAIHDFSKGVGFKLDNIYVMDGSKRSSKGNAYFSGLGAKKRIVLFDTLIKDLNTSEIVAVLAHEIGHYKKKHTITGIIISLLNTGLMFYILGIVVDNPQLSQALGAAQASFHMGLIAFGVLYSPVSNLLGIGMNLLSRYNEYQADNYASEKYNGEDLGSALKKLSVKSLSNLTPHPAYVFFHYSHPPLLERLKMLKEKKAG